MKLSEKQLEQVSGAIITSFVNLHFLEEAKASGLFRHQTKKHVNRVINDLIEIENNYFAKVEEVDDKDLSSQDNLIVINQGITATTGKVTLEGWKEN